MAIPSAGRAAGPSVTPSIRGTLGSNGWYTSNVTVNWTIDPLPDSTSGCDAYTVSADTTGNTRTCSATWGSTTISYTLTLKVDKTAPTVTGTTSRVPDSNGWYNHALTVPFSGSDGTSGIASCSSPSYSGPDSASASVSGSCTDKAGNSASGTVGFKYDDTAPVVSATTSRVPDSNGWYNHGLTVSFSGSDGTSGVASCSSPVSYSGPDSAGAAINGTCTDKAGNIGSGALPFQYDDTAPVVSATTSRVPDSNGWYNHGLTVSFSGSDGTSGIAGCSSASSYSGPDSAGASVSGSCTDKAGNTASGTAGFKYDDTAPVVGGSASRAPDSNGWYNHTLTVPFSGSDATSGIAGCSSPSYSGPDNASASVSGSCTDKAGNSASGTVGFKYDDTAPVVSATTSRVPDSNGWYNHGLTVSFSGSDGTSGVAGCSSPASYSGPDSAGASVSGSCTDKAGNSASGAAGFKYDDTAPVVSGSAGRAPDANGWYNHALTVSFSGSDLTSGIASCSSPIYSGPDSASASVSGSCTDKAGNSATGAVGFKYDANGPVVRGTASRAPDSNGWYNRGLTVSFSGTDGISGVAGCSSPVTYSGPDNSGAAVYGTCSDNAGNTGTGALSLQYDATPPSIAGSANRGPDANGWYNHALTVSFSGSDITSGIGSCSSPTYSGPDSSSASVSGSCTDKAGNTASGTVGFKYDDTAPAVKAAAGRAPDSNGWYNHGLTVSFSGSDGTSGLAGCSSPASYSGPDNSGAAVYGTCSDNAGNTGTGALALQYDATPPVVTGAPGRPPDANGWFNHSVQIRFSGADATSGIASCSSPTYSGPDKAGATIPGSCRDNAGNTASGAVSFKYDATPPTVKGALSRPPDANGWYNHPLTVYFTGGDGTSGIAGCSSPAYSGPDSSDAAVSGNCRDRAGNSRSAAVSFKYDATPPTLRKLTVKHLDRSVLIRWRASADTQSIEIVRSPGAKGERQTRVYSGAESAFQDTHLRPGRKYRYTVTASDAAANAVSKSMTVTATGALLAPTPGEHVSSPPRLVWTRVKGASYYNVQLLRRGRRILSIWPRGASLQLTGRWTYKGHTYRLRPGLYRWYVWPGFGKLAQANYGHLLGGSSFVASG